MSIPTDSNRHRESTPDPEETTVLNTQDSVKCVKCGAMYDISVHSEEGDTVCPVCDYRQPICEETEPRLQSSDEGF